MFRVTLISNFLEFHKAGSTTSRYVAMEIKTHFRFSLGQDMNHKQWSMIKLIIKELRLMF